MTVFLSQQILQVSFELYIIIDPDKVRLIEVIGRGTYGVVHKAVWRGSIVAVKQISTPSSTVENDRLIKAFQ